MAKIVLNTVSGGYDLSVINENFNKIAEEFQNDVLYRNNPNGEINTLENDIDVNGKHLYNLAEPVNENEAARLKDVQNAISGNNVANLVSFTPTGDISATNVQEAIVEVNTFLQDGNGAVPRYNQDKMREVSVSITDYGGDPTASGAINSAAMAAAKTALALRGGGFIDIPAGEFTFDCTDPAGHWNNRFCFRHTVDNIIVRGAGIGATILKVGDAQNAHMIQFGQRTAGTITVQNCGVMDLTIDGNRANQTAIVDAVDNHQQGIDVSSGCSGTKLHRLHVKNCMYYGIGFQRDNYQNCSVEGVVTEDTGADGLDWKDDSGLNSGNTINGLVVRRFGLVAVLAQQAGLNIRGGVNASNIFVTEYSGTHHGIRFDPTVATAIPSRLTNWFCKPSAVDTTVGLYINIPGGSDINDAIVSNGDVIGAFYGVDARWRFAKVSNVTAKACFTGFRTYKDNQFNTVMARDCTVAGYKVNDSNNVFINASAYGCLLGADIDAASTISSFRGGVFSGNTTNITDAGTQTAISQVAGINTHSVGTANLAIDSTGVKTVSIPHGLHFTPSVNDVVISFQRNTNVGDFIIGFYWVFSADATNVNCQFRVSTASVTVGALLTVVANCMAKKALRQ